METKYWRYKAYDAKFEVIEGVLASPSFVDMVLKLRQEGWQIISATTIDQGTYEAELRLLRWQQLFPTEIPRQTEVRHPVASLIRRIGSWITRLFFIK